MWRLSVCIFICLVHVAFGSNQIQHHQDICGNHTQRARSCTTQIWGGHHSDVTKCHIQYYETNSNECKTMNFGPINDNSKLGGVSLRPYILSLGHYTSDGGHSLNRAVLNISFSNIKWKNMKFRFQRAKYRFDESHCRDIILSNDVKVDDKSVLYYDCYWPIIDNTFNRQSHILDFEASDGNIVNRGQYYFNIPSIKMLSKTVTEEEWQPFLYIETMTSTIKLHIVPPPTQLNITGYEIKVMKETDKGTLTEKVKSITLKNFTQDTTYEHTLMNNGSYYFLVTPQHRRCSKDSLLCQTIESPKIVISSTVQRLDICIASATALVVAVIFAYYLALRLARRRWCGADAKAKDEEAAAPGQCVLVVYPGTSLVHRDCVRALVAALRRRGLGVRWDGDAGARDDPFAWAVAAWAAAGAVLWVPGSAGSACGPGAEAAPTRHVDRLVLSLLRAGRGRRRVAAALFPHAAAAPLPPETRDGPACRLPKDWGKLLVALGVPKSAREPLASDQTGRCLLEELERAEGIFSKKHDELILNMEKDGCENKVLI